MTGEPITPEDLEAYADGHLSPRRRFEVEHHLAQNPGLAAAAMAALSGRGAIRLLHEDSAPITPAAQAAALRLELELELELQRPARWPRGLRAAAVVALVALAGITGLRLGGAAVRSPDEPAFLAEATRAHETALLRAAMTSQPEATVYDPAEIRSATRITLPALPANWRVADVQVFPSQGGPTVEMALETPNIGDASLFAARTSHFAVTEPTRAQSADGALVYWQMGHTAYALAGEAKGVEVERAAHNLSRSLH